MEIQLQQGRGASGSWLAGWLAHLAGQRKQVSPLKGHHYTGLTILLDLLTPPLSHPLPLPLPPLQSHPPRPIQDQVEFALVYLAQD